MSKQTEALKLALETLEQWDDPFYKRGKAITAIREALAEQPAQQQEPVARCMEHGECFGGECIYTSPPASKPWVGLTQEDRVEIWKKSASIDGAINATASTLREKNA